MIFFMSLFLSFTGFIPVIFAEESNDNNFVDEGIEIAKVLVPVGGGLFTAWKMADAWQKKKYRIQARKEMIALFSNNVGEFFNSMNYMSTKIEKNLSNSQTLGEKLGESLENEFEKEFEDLNQKFKKYVGEYQGIYANMSIYFKDESVTTKLDEVDKGMIEAWEVLEKLKKELTVSICISLSNDLITKISTLKGNLRSIYRGIPKAKFVNLDK